VKTSRASIVCAISMARLLPDNALERCSLIIGAVQWLSLVGIRINTEDRSIKDMTTLRQKKGV
jgi:hypothetical protein